MLFDYERSKSTQWFTDGNHVATSSCCTEVTLKYPKYNYLMCWRRHLVAFGLRSVDEEAGTRYRLPVHAPTHPLACRASNNMNIHTLPAPTLQPSTRRWSKGFGFTFEKKIFQLQSTNLTGKRLRSTTKMLTIPKTRTQPV